MRIGRAVQRMLTRHEFATVQAHLSTVYFSSSAVLAGMSLGTFLLRHPFKTWSREATKLVRIEFHINSIVFAFFFLV